MKIKIVIAIFFFVIIVAEIAYAFNEMKAKKAKSYTVISKSGKEWHNVKNVGYHEFITEDGIVIYFSGDFIRIEKR